MFQTALAAFVGCFAATLALAEVPAANRWLRYLAALLVGVVATFVLAWLLAWVGHIFARV
jgi:hypothetical protein